MTEEEAMRENSNQIKVKIAVAVDPKGEWSACGWKGADDADMISGCRDNLDYGDIVYWLEADLEIPNPQLAASTVDRLGVEKDLKSAIENAIERLNLYGGDLNIDAVQRLRAFAGLNPVTTDSPVVGSDE